MDNRNLEELTRDLLMLKEQVKTLENLINGVNNRGGIINELEAIKKEQEKTNTTLTSVSEAVTKNKQDYDLNMTAIKSYLKGVGAILIVAEVINLFFQLVQYVK